MRYLLLLVFFTRLAFADTVQQTYGHTVVPACSNTTGVTVGTLTLRARSPRVSGIGPLLAFFDATATTDSATLGGANNPFQDITYSWQFGDGLKSGSRYWAYGSNPNKNQRNFATGAVASHLYVTEGKNKNYTVILTADDGTNSAQCGLGVSVTDPFNGFAGTQTTCVAAASTPTSGSGGCPAGAGVLQQSSFVTALASKLGSGKRVLFKCGDTFSGDGAILNGTTWSVGAYGGCEGTKSGRPIFHDPGATGAIIVAYTAGDGRIADIDFEGAGTGAAAVTTLGGNSQINYQITLYNLNSTGNSASYAWSQGAQWGLIDSVMNGMRSSIGTFVNYNENNPATWSGNVFNNLNYQAILGNLLNGAGNQSNGSGQEVLRLSACRLCAIENNTIQNANNIGGVLKLHNGNTMASLPTWSGVYTELIEVSDNSFGGTSGGILVDIEPQNNNDDERLRNLVFERNIVAGITANWGSPGQLRASVVNFTVRNNAFYDLGQGVHAYAQYMLNIGQLGIEPVPTGFEVYNNTCYMPNPQDNSQSCFAFNGVSMNAPPQNGDVEGNMFFAASGTHTMIVSTGAGITIANNSGNSAGNPAFINAGGSFLLMSDFKPTANYTGGVSLPGVKYDALGVTRTSTDLGAVQH